MKMRVRDAEEKKKEAEHKVAHLLRVVNSLKFKLAKRSKDKDGGKSKKKCKGKCVKRSKSQGQGVKRKRSNGKDKLSDHSDHSDDSDHSHHSDHSDHSHHQSSNDESGDNEVIVGTGPTKRIRTARDHTAPNSPDKVMHLGSSTKHSHLPGMPWNSKADTFKQALDDIYWALRSAEGFWWESGNKPFYASNVTHEEALAIINEHAGTLVLVYSQKKQKELRQDRAEKRDAQGRGENQDDDSDDSSGGASGGASGAAAGGSRQMGSGWGGSSSRQ
jgi:hypothetical protein